MDIVGYIFYIVFVFFLIVDFYIYVLLFFLFYFIVGRNEGIKIYRWVVKFVLEVSLVVFFLFVY